MLRWLRSLDWTAISTSALVLTIALWVIQGSFGHPPDHAAAQTADQYTGNPEGTSFKVHRQEDSTQARPVSFAGGKLNGANLENADAASVDFSNCIMKRVNFGSANLKGANFQGALLQGATFTHAKLADANFSGAVLTGLNVKELPLAPAQLKSCVLEPGSEVRARLPELTERLEAALRWVESEWCGGQSRRIRWRSVSRRDAKWPTVRHTLWVTEKRPKNCASKRAK